MKNKKSNSRYLKHLNTAFDNNQNFPVGMSYTQLYTGIVLDEAGISALPGLPIPIASRQHLNQAMNADYF